MPRRSPVLVCAFALSLAAAGCGSGSKKPYTAAATAPCLRANGFEKVTTNPDKVGFVAGFADNGGVRAMSGNNVLTIAFAGDASGAPAEERAFKQHASGVYKRHIADVMSSQGNAVLVWTVTPSQKQLDSAVGCLKS